MYVVTVATKPCVCKATYGKAKQTNMARVCLPNVVGSMYTCTYIYERQQGTLWQSLPDHVFAKPLTAKQNKQTCQESASQKKHSMMKGKIDF